MILGSFFQGRAILLGDGAHIQIARLWEYSKDPTTLESQLVQHLAYCEDCMGILWLCRSSESFQQAKDTLREHGITGV